MGDLSPCQQASPVLMTPLHMHAATAITNHSTARLTTAYSFAYLMRFLEVIRGTRIAAPTRLLPVTKMPLQIHIIQQMICFEHVICRNG